MWKNTRAFYRDFTVSCGPSMEHNNIRWITVDEIDQYEFCPADDVLLDRLRSQSKLENNL